MQNSWDAIRKSWATAPRSKNKPRVSDRWVWTMGGWIRSDTIQARRRKSGKDSIAHQAVVRYKEWLDRQVKELGYKPSKQVRAAARREFRNQNRPPEIRSPSGRLPRVPDYSNNYKGYIVSAEWFAKRREVFKERGRKCEDCGVTRGIIQVHHLTYERLGKEKLDDLLVLCLDCHERRHKRKFRS